MSLTSSSSSRDRNKYGRIWRWSINFFKGCSLYYGDAIYRRVIPFVCSMNHIPPYLFRSREDDDDVRDMGKHDFRSVLLLPMLSNANLLRMTKRYIEPKLDKYFNLVVRLRVSHRVIKRLEAVFCERRVELAN